MSAVLLSLALLATAHAETKTVVGEGDSGKLACFGRATAAKLAASGAEFNGHEECRALGKGWSPSVTKFPGYSQCTPCGQSGEFRCKVTQAVFECVNMQKENDAKAAKEKAARELAAGEAKRKADLERADATAAALDKKKKADEKATRAHAKAGAADKAPKPAVPGKPVPAGNAIDDAFAKLEKQSGPKSPSKSGGIDDQFGKMEVERAEKERQRVAAEKLKAEQLARRNELVRVCEKDVGEQTSCLQNACGVEPPETVTERDCRLSQGEAGPMHARMEISGEDNYSQSIFAEKGDIIFRQRGYSCDSKEVPNKKHDEWEVCAKAKSSSCARNGLVARSVNECVKQRESVARSR